VAVTGVKAVFSGACRHVAIRAHLALLAAVLVPSCLGTASLSRHGPCVCWGGRAAPSARCAAVLVRHALTWHSLTASWGPARPVQSERLCKVLWRRRLGTGYASAGACEVDWSKKGIWFAGGRELDQVRLVADFRAALDSSALITAAAVLLSQTPLVYARCAASCCVVMLPARAGGGAALWERRARARGRRMPGLDTSLRRPGLLRLGGPAEQAGCRSRSGCELWHVHGFASAWRHLGSLHSGTVAD